MWCGGVGWIVECGEIVKQYAGSILRDGSCLQSIYRWNALRILNNKTRLNELLNIEYTVFIFYRDKNSDKHR